MKKCTKFWLLFFRMSIYFNFPLNMKGYTVISGFLDPVYYI